MTEKADRPLVRYRGVVGDSARWDGFSFRPDDIVISTPPKCGTTWTQMICALLIFQTPDLERPLSMISPWLDMQTRSRDDVMADLAAQTHRRFIKTHTPLDGLPYDKRVTYICVGRDPRDVALSMDSHWENMDMDAFVAVRAAAVGDDDDVTELLAARPERAPTPRERFWVWVDNDTAPADASSSLLRTLYHFETFWNVRDAGNIVMLHYSELKANLEGEMRALAVCLAIEVPEEQWPGLVAAASFDAMRRNVDKTVPNIDKQFWRDPNKFFNRGTSGQWRELLDASDLTRYDKRVASLVGPDLAACGPTPERGRAEKSFARVSPRCDTAPSRDRPARRTHAGVLMRLHLDTDFAGDTDDACALAMLLGWDDVEVVGITTVADPDGRRAGYVSHFLDLVGRAEISVAAGAGVSLTTGQPMGELPDDATYWPEPVAARPSRPGDAIALLAAAIDRGATIVAIGPYTNLALLEEQQPGILQRVRVVTMGGWMQPPADGLPPWGPDMDWNVQCDTWAARTVVAATADLTLVTLPATLAADLRAVDLGRLERSGSLGRLLARQAQAHAAEHQLTTLGCTYRGLPDDLLNFQYDPVACAVALGWPGAVVEEVRVRPVLERDVLRFQRDPEGTPVRAVVAVDGSGFAETWLAAVERAQRPRDVTIRAERPADRDAIGEVVAAAFRSGVEARLVELLRAVRGLPAGTVARRRARRTRRGPCDDQLRPTG